MGITGGHYQIIFKYIKKTTIITTTTIFGKTPTRRASVNEWQMVDMACNIRNAAACGFQREK